MNDITFILYSYLYLFSLATVDGLFNRLVFGKHRKNSNYSSQKQRIYRQWEWKAIGAVLLIFLPFILPSAISFLFGGISLVLLYWIVLLLTPWDLIFGKLVFDDWFRDSPSIALPYIGWIRMRLIKTIVLRVGLALIFIGMKIRFGL